MFSILIWVLVGVFVGWHFPQPSWIKKAEDEVVLKVKDKIKK